MPTGKLGLAQCGDIALSDHVLLRRSNRRRGGRGGANGRFHFESIASEDGHYTRDSRCQFRASDEQKSRYSSQVANILLG